MEQPSPSPRGEERIQNGHFWVYRGDVARRSRGAWRGRPRRRRERPFPGARFLQRSIADHAADSDTPRRARRSRLLALAARAARSHFARRSASMRRAYRLVHGEGDLIPSLIVDRYGDYIVLQALSQGSDGCCPRSRRCSWRSPARRASSRATIRACGCSKGSSRTSPCFTARFPSKVAVREGQIEYDVDLRHGQKTGAFLDQRENRIGGGAVRERADARLLQLRRRLLRCSSRRTSTS